MLATSPSWKSARLVSADLQASHLPDSNPVIDAGGCAFIPDVSDPVSFACGVDNSAAQFAYLGAPLYLDLNVSSPDGAPINVTVWWDTAIDFSVWPFSLQVVNGSAVQYFDVAPTGPDQPVHIRTEWTYWVHSNWEIVAGTSSYYNVSVNASSASGSDAFTLQSCTTRLPYGNCFFQIAVATNTAPFVYGLGTAYTVSLPPPDPVIPPFSLGISVLDTDNDPVLVVWDWGDGNVSMNASAAAGVRTFFNATHTYAFAVTVTPKYQNYTLRVSVDDGVQTHNRTTDVLISYFIAYDGMPSIPSFLSPLPGSKFQVGESVPIEASLLEPEGELMSYYWDYGDGVLSGLNTTYNGTVYTAHAYASAGPVNITVWATDGSDKALCLDLNENCTLTRSHWAHLTMPMVIESNRAPVPSLTVSFDPGVYGKDARFAVVAWDPDGDNLTVTWCFGDQEWVHGGAWAVNQTTGGNGTLRFNQVHNYTHWGYAPTYTFNVTAWVDDGHGHNVSSVRQIFVGSENNAPTVSAAPPADSAIYVNETVSVNITVWDLEGDTIWIDVDFGDNTSWHGNVTPEANVSQSLIVEHAYTEAGNYTINITVSDHMIAIWLNETGAMVGFTHTISTPVAIDVLPPPPPPVSMDWTWVDYTTLAAVLAIPIAGAVRYGYRRYLERRED